MNPPVEPSLNEAIRAWGAGDRESADRLARAVLATQPDNALALNIAGCASFERAEAAVALALFEKAARLAPGDVGIQCNLARGELATGRIEPALRRAHYWSVVNPNAAALPQDLARELIQRARPAAIAGSFYERDPARLAAAVDGWLGGATSGPGPHPAHAPDAMQAGQPKVLIVPHAGHIYSGQTAGAAYALLRPFAGRIRRVVMLGPAHRVALRGVALPGVGSHVSPLGAVPIDTLAADAIADMPCVSTRPDVHAPEHCMEVHLPFLQRVLPRFELLPLVVGDVSPGELLPLIGRLWGDERTLLVISTDLSHFHAYDDAVRIDSTTCAQIRTLTPVLDHQQACGATPLNALLAFARERQLRIQQIGLCNSGDTAGDRARVVGYASFALYEPPQTPASPAGPMPELDAAQGEALVRLARQALNEATGAQALDQGTGAHAPGNHRSHDLAGVLRQPGAAFVTLTQDGQLRGCIGSLQAHRPLADDVTANAAAAALSDPRFAPVSAREAAGLRVEVSVLTPAQAMEFANESHAIWQLRPGQDGLILACDHQGRGYRSTYLPQVWEQIPEPRAFLAHLKTKAGLPHDFWSPGMRLWRYRVLKFTEAQ